MRFWQNDIESLLKGLFSYLKILKVQAVGYETYTGPFFEGFTVISVMMKTVFLDQNIVVGNSYIGSRFV